MGDAGIKNLHGVLRAAVASGAVGLGEHERGEHGATALDETKRRTAMTFDEVRAVIAAGVDRPGGGNDVACGGGDGCSPRQLAALRWTDLSGDVLTIDSAIGKRARGQGEILR